MTAACSGSAAAMLAAKQAPIGARICTVRAIRTMGKKFRNRRRINEASLFELGNQTIRRVRSRDQAPGDIAPCIMVHAANEVIPMRHERQPTGRDNFAVCAFLHTGPRLPYPLTPMLNSRRKMQPAVAKSQSFRRLLEF